MSGTPRRINTDRSLGTPSAGGGAGGGVPPKAPPPPSGPAPQEDDGQSFFRPAASEMEPPAQPRRAEPDPGQNLEKLKRLLKEQLEIMKLYF